MHAAMTQIQNSATAADRRCRQKIRLRANRRHGHHQQPTPPEGPLS